MYKSVKKVFQYFCFPDRSIKGGDIMDFQKGVDLEKEGYKPPLPTVDGIKEEIKNVTN